MKVKRTNKLEADTLKVGDIIKFRLNDGEKIHAMAVKKEVDGMLFCCVDCLKKHGYMSLELNTAKRKEHQSGRTPLYGWADSSLRKILNDEILALYPEEIKALMVPVYANDLLRVPTEKEIHGRNEYGDYDFGLIEQWKPMKKRRNRIALLGDNGEICSYTTMNTARNYDSEFTSTDTHGEAGHHLACYLNGVRPVFKLKITEGE